jgi:hypothetical protein
MPISPYSTPIQYEYKPLNLSAFAAPLSEMQQKFDIVTDAVESADFAISNLSYGKDPERAKELIKLVKSKRDELSKSLSETKNYKQAATKLKELNTLWAKDPELNALQANAKLWAERDKEERERIDKPGGITRDQYLQWKDEEIHKYKKAGGAGFQADASNPEGTYNVITGSTGRLADLDKEFRDLQIKIAEMNPAKSISYFTQNGVSMSPEEKVSFQTTIDSKDANEIARETEKYLRKIPKFREWGQEVARYNYNQATGYGENLEQTAKPLVNNSIANIDAQIAYNLKNTKGFKDSKDYKDLLDTKEDLTEMATTGKYDPGMVQALYTQEHLNNLYNSQDIGEILAYKNTKTTGSVRKNYEWEAQQAAKAAVEAAGGVSVIPTTENLFSIDAQTKIKRDAGKDLRTSNRQINDLVDGNIRAAILGDEGSDLRKRLLNNPDQVRARQEQLLTAITTTIQQGGDWKTLQALANAKGIKMGEGRSRAIIQSMSKNNNLGISNYSKYLDESKESYEKYNTANSLIQEVQKGVETTQQFKDFIDDYGNTPINTPGFGLTVPRGQGASNMSSTLEKSIKGYNTLFNKNSYSEATLKKLGISKNDKALTLNEFARIKGYKNVNDAVNKGYNFENIEFVGGNVAGMVNYNKNKIYKEGLDKNVMGYKMIGTPEVNKTLTAFFSSPEDILAYAPAYSKDWKDQPGFDEKGEVAKGTYINTKVPPRLISHGNKLLYEVSIFYTKDNKKTQGVAIVDAKASMGTQNLSLLDNLDANSQGNSAVNKQANQMIKAAKFDVKFAGNPLSPQLISSVDPVVGNKGTQLYTVPVDNYNRLEIVKLVPEKGAKPIIMVAQIDANTGARKGYLNNPDTGKPWYEDATAPEAAASAKNLIMQALGE